MQTQAPALSAAREPPSVPFCPAAGLILCSVLLGRRPAAHIHTRTVPSHARGAKGPLKGLQPALVCEPATACHFYFINPASRACSPGECGLGLSSGLTGLGPVQEVRHEPEALCPVWKLTARFLQGCRRLAPTEKLNKQRGGMKSVPWISRAPEALVLPQGRFYGH